MYFQLKRSISRLSHEGVVSISLITQDEINYCFHTKPSIMQMKNLLQFSVSEVNFLFTLWMVQIEKIAKSRIKINFRISTKKILGFH